ncbi:hypothetical protein AWENTII_011538 [Aspergillus wentii]
MDGQSTILSVLGPLATTAQSVKLLFKAILSQQPWFHDPLVLEIPWRDDIERETQALIEQSRTGSSKLSFAIIRHNKQVQPDPPIARAMGMVESTLKRLGHRVIEWNPPSHDVADEIAAKAYGFDGGADITHHLGLSGESLAPQVIVTQGKPQMNAQEVAAVNVQKREYQKLYMEYWNSTAELTGTGRPVDGVLCPVAVHAAAIPGKYGTVGYTTFVNVLDYTTVVIPVTHVDKRVDVVPENMEVLNDIDKANQDEYDAGIYDGAPVGLQLIGRRLQEEKMLTLADYIGAEVEKDQK